MQAAYKAPHGAIKAGATVELHSVVDELASDQENPDHADNAVRERDKHLLRKFGLSQMENA